MATANSRPLVRISPPWLWLGAVLFFGVGDVVTTAVGLSVPGVVEADPIARPLLREFGLAALLALKAAAFGACYLGWAIVPRPYCRGVPLGLAGLGLVVTAWNTLVVTSAVLA